MAEIIAKPEMQGTVLFEISPKITIFQIEKVLGKLIKYQIYDELIEVTYRELIGYQCWEIDELLNELFKLCDFEEIAIARRFLNAKVHIDLSFYQYGKYPALIFAGENMRIIHEIQADISIDMY